MYIILLYFVIREIIHCTLNLVSESGEVSRAACRDALGPLGALGSSGPGELLSTIAQCWNRQTA